ncbi:hypothetical protein GEMRC1_008684 [Eukaryota sp. GEM-RC1]
MQSDLDKSFACCVCLDVMSSPVLLSPCGHSVCSHCSTKLNSKCPLCRSSVSSLTDNLVLRSIIQDYFSQKSRVDTNQKQFHSLQLRLANVHERRNEVAQELGDTKANISTYTKVVHHLSDEQRRIAAELEIVNSQIHESNSHLEGLKHNLLTLETKESKLNDLYKNLLKEYDKARILNGSE